MDSFPEIDTGARSAAQLGALISAGIVSAEDISERTLAAIAAHRDQAIFTRVTAGRALTVPPAGGPPPAGGTAREHARRRSRFVDMTEFAYSGIGLDPHYGTPRNPNGHGAARAPGGSVRIPGRLQRRHRLQGFERPLSDERDIPPVADARHARHLFAEGAVIERRQIPVLDEIGALNKRFGTIVAAETYALHRERVEGPAAAAIDRRVAKRIAAAAGTTMADCISALQARARLMAGTAEMLAGRCLVAMPTVPHVAPVVEPLEAYDELFARVNLKTLRNTALGSYLGWCGVSIPAGTDAAGLPAAVLLSGAPGADEQLLTLCLRAEAAIRKEDV